MTTGAEPEAMQETPVAGRIFGIGARTAICSFPLPSSMPIPLGMTRPAAIDLLTWAFAGLGTDAPNARARCLLVLAARDAEARASLIRDARLSVAMHFRDLAVALTEAAPGETLPPGDLAILARAILSATTPATISALADLAPLIARPAAELSIADDAPELVLSEDGRTVALFGKTVSNYMLTRSEGELACARVARARLRFGRQPRSELTLEHLWGREPGPDIESAIFLGSGGFTPVRVRPG